MDGTKDAGLNRVQWNLRWQPAARARRARAGAVAAAVAAAARAGAAVEPGTYLVKLSVGGKDYTTKVVVEADPIVR